MSQMEADERAAQRYAALLAASARHDKLATDAPQVADSPVSSSDGAVDSPEVAVDPEKCFNPKVWSEQPQLSDALSPSDRKFVYSRKLVWVLVVLAVLVVAGAIGGGVGGGIINQRNRRERERDSERARATVNPAIVRSVFLVLYARHA